MKPIIQPLLFFLLSYTLLGEKSLFDGIDLEGWDGNPIHRSVEDGAIVGVNTKENPTKGNTLLIRKVGTLKDFDLTIECKIDSGNSGNALIPTTCRPSDEVFLRNILLK